ncbi:hypothetical protein [Cetobacterium somerae]|uniref:hypothetical protein n=1 Tax=Cetobacterium somerae TaxID=188913 RepID=UPI003891A308
MTKNRKILIGIIGAALFGIAFSFIQKPLNNRKVLKVIQEEIPDDKFYFIRGLDRDRSLSTNIRYRGIVYSDKLKEAGSFSGIQVALENLNKAYLYGSEFKRQYEGALAYPLATAPMKENAKKIFGNDIIVYVDFPMIWDLKGQTEFVQNNIGKETNQIANMTGYIDIFVDDITKVNIDDYKKKLFELHQILYKTYHIDSDINMYLRDKKYLTYEQIESNIFYIFRDEPKVKELLKKYKDNGNLNADEIGYLTNYFVDTFGNYNLPSILFQMKLKRKTYKEINVIIRGGN